tara:strand:- start:1912 stop:2256 length:345 start_codon:yes stop_codon:yes gene_type:complete
MLNNNEIKVGQHYIININNVENKFIFDNRCIIELMNEIIELYNLTVLEKILYPFAPYGFTGIYLLSESHLSFHTWPEHNKICIDLFTCGKNNKCLIKELLEKNFSTISIQVMDR